MEAVTPRMVQAKVYVGLASSGFLGRCPRLLLPPVRSPVEHLQEEKQPASEGLRWIQQAAFVSPNFQTPQKATVGRGLLSGKGATSLERNSGKKQLHLCPGPYAVCFIWDAHTCPDYKEYTHKHISKSNRSAEFVKWTLLHISIFKFLMKGVHTNYWWWGSFRML